MSRWLFLAALLVACGLQLGCKSTKKHRIMRQPMIEEYNLPPSEDQKFTEGPFYPDQKRQLPSQIKAQQLPAAKGGGIGAGGGPGGAGGGGPAGPGGPR